LFGNCALLPGTFDVAEKEFDNDLGPSEQKQANLIEYEATQSDAAFMYYTNHTVGPKSLGIKNSQSGITCTRTNTSFPCKVVAGKSAFGLGGPAVSGMVKAGLAATFDVAIRTVSPFPSPWTTRLDKPSRLA
jgi:hypothetical protein